MSNERDAWAAALRRTTWILDEALAEVNAKVPPRHYPWWRELIWRWRGVPSEVVAEQHWLGKTRAQLLLLEMQRRRDSA